MGRLYDAYVEVGPRFAGFGDIKKQGDRAGKEYGKALAAAAQKAAAADVRKLGEALAKARNTEADAIGKVRIAEAKLADVRKNFETTTGQLLTAEEALASAQRKSAAASSTAKDAAESLGKAQKRVADLAESGGKNAGGRFSNAFKSGLTKLNGDREGKQFATRFGVGMNGAIGGIVSRSAGVFVAGFAAIKSAQVFGSFINDARESAKVARVSAQVVKSTGGAAKITAGQIGDLATAISNKTGADDEDVQSGENLLATFTNVRNEVGKNNDIFSRASQAAVDMASAMNNGVVDANGLKAANIQLGKALNDPVKGVTALSKVGVSFTADQKKQIKTLVDSGKTLEAQKIILGEVGKEFGGAAAAASDPLTKLSVIAGNAKEAVGGAFLPIVDKVASKLGKFIPDAVGKASVGLSALGAAFKGEGVTSDGFVGVMERIGVAARTAFDFFKTDVLPRLKDFGGFLIGTVVPAVAGLAKRLVAELGPAVKDVFGFFRTDVIPRLKDFASFLGDKVLPPIKDFADKVLLSKDFLVPFAGIILGVIGALKAWAIAQGILNFVMSANPIGLVVVAIAGLVAGLIYAYKHSEKFRDIVNGVFGAVKTVAVGAFDGIKAAVNGVVTAFNATKNAIGTAIGAVGAAFTAVKNGVGTAIGAVKNAFSTAVSFIGSVWKTIVTAVSGPVNAVIGVLNAVWSRISPILALPFYIAKKVIATTFAGIQVIFSTVAGWVTGVFSKAWNAVTGVLAGPVNAAKRFVDKTWVDFKLGFTIIKGWVTGAFAKGWAAVKSVLSVPVRNAKSTLDSVWSGIKSAFNAVKSFATGAFSTAWAGLKKILTTPITLAKNAITTILSAGKGGLRWVFSQAVSGISTIWNGLQSLAKKPIRFIIDTVLNKGLIAGFNWIANKFDAPTIKAIPLPKGFAAGGHFTGRLPGKPSAVDNLIGYAKGGAFGLASGEYVVNAKQTAKHLPLLESINGGRGGYADGGLIGGLKKAITTAFTIGSPLGAVTNKFLGDPVKWLKDRFTAPLNALSKLGDSPVAQIVSAVPRKLGSTIADKAKSLLGLGGGGGGFNASLAGVLDFVRSQVGKPYVWGGVGPGGFDCSGLVSAAINVALGRNPYSRLGSTGSMPWGVMAPGAGAFSIGWFKGNPGHTAATVNGTNIESSGGRGVHMGPGARGATNGLFTNIAHLKGFAQGGRIGDAPFDLLDPRGKKYVGKDLAQQVGVYDRGGRWPSGTIGVNTSGKTETVIPGDGQVELSDRSLQKLAALLADRPITLDGRRVDAAMSSSAISRGYR